MLRYCVKFSETDHTHVLSVLNGYVVRFDNRSVPMEQMAFNLDDFYLVSPMSTFTLIYDCQEYTFPSLHDAWDWFMSYNMDYDLVDFYSSADAELFYCFHPTPEMV